MCVCRTQEAEEGYLQDFRVGTAYKSNRSNLLAFCHTLVVVVDDDDDALFFSSEQELRNDH